MIKLIIKNLNELQKSLGANVNMLVFKKSGIIEKLTITFPITRI